MADSVNKKLIVCIEVLHFRNICTEILRFKYFMSKYYIFKRFCTVETILLSISGLVLVSARTMQVSERTKPVQKPVHFYSPGPASIFEHSQGSAHFTAQSILRRFAPQTLASSSTGSPLQGLVSASRLLIPSLHPSPAISAQQAQARSASTDVKVFPS